MKRRRNPKSGPLIFVVFTKAEEEIARALKELLFLWGCQRDDIYFSDTLNPPSGAFQKLLRDKLKPAPVVLILLSSDFIRSLYAQAEAGAAITMERQVIPMVIPPLNMKDVNKICPIFDTSHDNLFYFEPDNGKTEYVTGLKTMLKNACEQALSKRLNRDTSLRLHTFLRGLARTEGNPATEVAAFDEVGLAYKRVNESYGFRPPLRFLQERWANITDDAPKNSIVGNIKLSLGSNDPRTRLIFVGVSLKISLPLIKRALAEFACEVREDKRLAPDKQKWPVRHLGKVKKLAIELVHMDDNSHLLHSLHDTTDIRLIRANFGKSWPKTKSEWKEQCELAGIELESVEKHIIGYIPPRVGILIDEKIFFAGRCAIKQVGDTDAFELKVGEEPYFYYTSDDPMGYGKMMIEAFQKSFLNGYKKSEHNGVVLVKRFDDGDDDGREDSHEWIRQLLHCVNDYQGVSQMTLISQSGGKFASLIEAVLKNNSHNENKIKLKVYVQHPERVQGEAKARIRKLEKILKVAKRNQWNCGIELYYYDREINYRVVLLEHDKSDAHCKEVLGFEMYVPDIKERRGFMPLIIPKNSHRFVNLKMHLMDPVEKNSIPAPGFV